MGIPAAEELPTGGGNGGFDYYYDTAATEYQHNPIKTRSTVIAIEERKKHHGVWLPFWVSPCHLFGCCRVAFLGVAMSPYSWQEEETEITSSHYRKRHILYCGS
jgi:hypothetical protein